PAAAHHLQRHPIGRQQALGQRAHTLGRGRYPTRRTNVAVLADRDLAKLAMHIQANRTPHPPRHSHTHLHSSTSRNGRTNGTTTQTDTSSKLNPGKSQARPNEKPGLEAHRPNRPTPLRSPNKAPVPDQPNLRSAP